MYRLLIVDDEPHVTDWLAELFGSLDRLELDICKAYSAKEALNWLNRSRIDIVITDISMPKMNGLELMRIIRSAWPECKIIFLTGYNEFDYAYEAIREDVSDYVLKTESDKVIVEAVDKAIRQIEESRRLKRLKLAGGEIGQALPLMRREFALELLAGRWETQSPEETWLRKLEIPLTAGAPVWLLLGRLDGGEDGPLSVSCLLFEIDAVLRGYLEPQFSIFFSPVGGRVLLWLLQAADPDDGSGGGSLPAGQPEVFLRDTLDTVQISLRESLERTVSFALSAQACGWGEIPERYGILKEIFDSAGEAESVVTDAGYHSLIRRSAFIKPVLKPEMADRFAVCLEKGDREDTAVLVEELEQAFRPITDMRSGEGAEAYYTVLLKLLAYINRAGLAQSGAAAVDIQKLMRLGEFKSWSDVMGLLSHAVEAAQKERSVRVSDMEKSVVDDVKRYIDAHIGDDVSLVRLAEVVHFNPSYLSRFFKQVSGMNLTDYIFASKIGRAQALLADNRVKIHDVASAVGFTSSTYFAKFFRRMTGVNPQEYRDGLNK